MWLGYSLLVNFTIWSYSSSIAAQNPGSVHPDWVQSHLWGVQMIRLLKEKVHYITSVVITYVHHQITTLRHGIKGGAQGTRWRTQPTRFEKKIASINSTAVIQVL